MATKKTTKAGFGTKGKARRVTNLVVKYEKKGTTYHVTDKNGDTTVVAAADFEALYKPED